MRCKYTSSPSLVQPSPSPKVGTQMHSPGASISDPALNYLKSNDSRARRRSESALIPRQFAALGVFIEPEIAAFSVAKFMSYVYCSAKSAPHLSVDNDYLAACRYKTTNPLRLSIANEKLGNRRWHSALFVRLLLLLRRPHAKKTFAAAIRLAE